MLIVGAGIAGLTLASALRDESWQVDLVDQTSTDAELGVGIVIHPNGMQVLERLGLADGVARLGNAVRSLTIVRGDQTRAIEFSEVWPGAKQPTVAITRAQLREVLAAAAEQRAPALAVRYGTRLVGLSLDDPWRPTATLGNAGAQRYDLVVGADGVHSSVRRLLDPTAYARPTDLTYTRWVAAVAGSDTHTWRTTERLDASYGTFPLGGGRAHYFVQTRTPRRGDSAGTALRVGSAPALGPGAGRHHRSR